jgi:hypothetical protein
MQLTPRKANKFEAAGFIVVSAGVRSEVLIALNMKNANFRNVTAC